MSLFQNGLMNDKATRAAATNNCKNTTLLFNSLQQPRKQRRFERGSYVKRYYTIPELNTLTRDIKWKIFLYI